MSRTTKVFLRIAGVALVAPLVLGPVCAPDGNQPSNVLVNNQMVTVGAGGGFGAVSFSASSGQTIRVTLTAVQASMDPYASLQAPDGSADYVPPLGSAVNGTNTAQEALTQTGTYTLVIFDGSNQGGNVTVRVERL